MTEQLETQTCGREKSHPTHRFMIGRQVRQCSGRAETPPALREQAIDAVARALNAGRYWLPAAGQAAAVDAVLALTGAELEASQRRAIRIQTLPDEQRDRARKDFAASRESERQLQQQIDRQASEIDRLKDALAVLHEGEEEPADEHIQPTPAQWIWQWNRATPEQRLDMAERILQAFGEASRCFIEAHASQAEDGHTAVASLRRVRALAEELDNTNAYGGMADGYYEAARRIRAALEPPKETPNA